MSSARSGAEAGTRARAVAVEIDLDAIRRNARRVAEQAGVPLLFVVKADAYGHGAIAVARALAAEICGRGFVVARPEEAFALRASGIDRPVLVLAPGAAALAPGERRALIAEMRGARLSPGIASEEELAPWLEGERAGRCSGEPLAVHVKVDTGLGRAGIEPSRLAPALERLSAASRLRLAGLYTHLAESECLESEFTTLQLDRFEAAARLLPESGATPLRHAANSAAALHWPRARYDLVRVGGALYGVDLAAPDARGELEPVMRCTARVIQRKRLDAGDSVGYGRRFVAREPRQVALLPIGYADGLASSAAEQAAVLLRGRRAPVLGAISMDLVSVDVTGLGVEVGDEAVILGEQGGDRIGVRELAAWSSSSPYECLCRLSRRIAPSYRGAGEAPHGGGGEGYSAGSRPVMRRNASR